MLVVFFLMPMELIVKERAISNRCRFEISIRVKIATTLPSKVKVIKIGNYISIAEGLICIAESEVAMDAVQKEHLLNKVTNRFHGVCNVAGLNDDERNNWIDWKKGFYIEQDKIFAFELVSGIRVAVYSFTTGKVSKILDREIPKGEESQRSISTIKY